MKKSATTLLKQPRQSASLHWVRVLICVVVSAVSIWSVSIVYHEPRVFFSDIVDYMYGKTLPSSRYDSLRLLHIYHHGREEVSDGGFAACSTESSFGSNQPFFRADVSRDDPVTVITETDLKEYREGDFEFHIRSRHSEDGILKPDQYDMDMLMALMQMCSNCYNERSSTSWVPVDGFPSNISVGWDGDGLRGYVFGSSNLLILAIKGTSATFFGVGSGPTSKRDKLEDNMMFSCCCAAVDYTWWPICSCADKKSCDLDCIRQFSDYPDSYVNIAVLIYKQLQILYPGTPIWFTGHSLGGSVASLAALRVGAPAVTFEAPGDQMFAQKMGWIDMKTSSSHRDIFAFGLSSDPIFVGQCTGGYSSCYLSGYAMESQCHIGNKCFFDNPISSPANYTDIRHHRLTYVMDKLKNERDTVKPFCYYEPKCEECESWKFGHIIDPK